MARYFFTPKNDNDFIGTSIRAIYNNGDEFIIEYSDGLIKEEWIETTLEELVQEFGRNPLEDEPQEEPTEEELIQAELLLNQIDIMAKQAEHDEVLAEILLNQLEV